MTTTAHPITVGLASAWESYYSSAVFSGIVGDPAHQISGGYHISIQDQSSTNYSVIRPDDKAPPGTWPRYLAAAIDMSMSPADMALCSTRLWGVWNDPSDPRRAFINGFNGWFNDGGSAKRYDFVTQKSSTTTSDHKWHVHLEIRRRYVTSDEAAKAIESILRGDTKQQFIDGLIGIGVLGMYAEKGMGINGSPISHDTMYAQAQLAFLAPHALTDAEHPLTIDGKFGGNTAWWNSIILTGGLGEKIIGSDFAKLAMMVSDKQINDKLATLPPPVNLPDQVELVIPSTRIDIPATTIMVDVNPV
jgi:hypothetical protein